MPAIFISYRRVDSKAYAGRLFDRLSQRFGAGDVFMDIEGGIARGDDFALALQRAVESVDVMIVLIGRQWLTCTDPAGRRRLDDPADWVRVETAAALRRDILILPVLVDGASTPPESELPSDMRALAKRQASEISDTRWKYDVDQIVALLEQRLRRKAWWRRPLPLAAAGTLLVALVIAVSMIASRQPPAPLASSGDAAVVVTAVPSASSGSPASSVASASTPADRAYIASSSTDPAGYWRDDGGVLYKVVATDGGWDMARIEPPEESPVYRKLRMQGRNVDIAIGVLPSGTQQEQANLELSVDGRFMTGLRKSTQVDEVPTNWVLKRSVAPRAAAAG